MSFEPRIITDFDKHIQNTEETRDWLKMLYYDPDFSSFFNRPILSMLMTGYDWLADNLQQLRAKYLIRRGE